jgi:hypothetical protein
MTTYLGMVTVTTSNFPVIEQFIRSKEAWEWK